MLFQRYIGIDYSGAQVPGSPLPGLRIYVADPDSAPREVEPPPGPGKYWTRRGIAYWLVERLSERRPSLVGIDHGFSFPQQYFSAHGLPSDWQVFLEDFRKHWPTDDQYTYVDFVREGVDGNGAARSGRPDWFRLTEVWARTAKSVFRFEGHGTVGKSTHSGLPWLLYLRKNVTRPVHFWPFDGWSVPAGKSVVAEVYPSLWRKRYAPESRNEHQHDAYSVAAWMREADRDGSLAGYFNPNLNQDERRIASIEGWILGVMDRPPAPKRPKIVHTKVAIPAELFEQFEETARRQRVSRNKLYAKALAEYVKRLV